MPHRTINHMLSPTPANEQLSWPPTCGCMGPDDQSAPRQGTRTRPPRGHHAATGRPRGGDATTHLHCHLRVALCHLKTLRRQLGVIFRVPGRIQHVTGIRRTTTTTHAVGSSNAHVIRSNQLGLTVDCGIRKIKLGSTASVRRTALPSSRRPRKLLWGLCPLGGRRQVGCAIGGAADRIPIPDFLVTPGMVYEFERGAGYHRPKSRFWEIRFNAVPVVEGVLV